MRSTFGYKAVGLLTGLLVIAGEATARADVPGTLTQQGLLLDQNNAPVTGSQTFVFTIYDAATAGTVLWTETQSITLDGGYFSTQLGSITAIPTTVFNGSTRYLGIKIGSDAEMTPREAVTSVPYAMVSRDATGDINPTSVTINGSIKVIDATGHWVGPTTGLAGTPGPTGPAGPTGAQGSTGAPGAAGTAGATGTPGTAGATGTAGAPGAAGTPGAPGAKGATGPAGATGATGTPGTPGATGTPGTPGATGTPGTPGATGAPGVGIQGPTGPTGVGAKGATGATGPTGSPGAPGATGAPGASVTGATGPAGVVMTATMHAAGPTPTPGGGGTGAMIIPTGKGLTQLSPSVTVAITAATDLVYVSAGADLWTPYDAGLTAGICSQLGTNLPALISDEPTSTAAPSHVTMYSQPGNYWVARDGVASGLAAGSTYAFFLCGSTSTGGSGPWTTAANAVGWSKTIAMILP